MLVIRRLFGTGTNCIAPSGLPLLLCLFPGLAPWAFLSRPCGASFAPETSLGLFRMWKAVSNGRSLRSNPPSPLNERLPLFEALKSGNGISLLSANHTLPIAMVRCRTWELTGKIIGRLEIVLFRVFLGASRKAGLTVSGFAESRCAGRSQDSSWPITAVCSLLLHFASPTGSLPISCFSSLFLVRSTAGRFQSGAVPGLVAGAACKVERVGNAVFCL